LNAQAEARAQLRARSAGFVEPARMPQLVRDLLAARAGLSLVRLANLPPEEIRAAIGDSSAIAAVGDGADDDALDAGEPVSAVAYSQVSIVVEGAWWTLRLSAGARSSRGMCCGAPWKSKSSDPRARARGHRHHRRRSRWLGT
jgi:hypothetical protein